MNQGFHQVILVSKSPRRRQILEDLGFAVQVIDHETAEELHPDLSPDRQTGHVSEHKLRSWLKLQAPLPKVPCLSGDTLIVKGRLILGKPKDLPEARAMLEALSGKTHSVFSSLSLFDPISGQITTKTAEAKVKFRPLNRDLIDFYLGTGDWEDAAGGYKIQKAGDLLVESVSGNYSTIVGLPIRLFYEMLSAIMPAKTGG